MKQTLPTYDQLSSWHNARSLRQKDILSRSVGRLPESSSLMWICIYINIASKQKTPKRIQKFQPKVWNKNVDLSSICRCRYQEWPACPARTCGPARQPPYSSTASCLRGCSCAGHHSYYRSYKPKTKSVLLLSPLRRVDHTLPLIDKLHLSVLALLSDTIGEHNRLHVHVVDQLQCEDISLNIIYLY